MKLGLLAGGVELLAFGLYNRNVFLRTSVPNAATWTLWVFLTILNASSYAAMTSDLAKYFFPIVASAATLLTFLFSLVTGKFRPLEFWDKVVLAIGICAGLVWWRYQSATYANLLVQLAIAIAFWPTYRGVWRNPAVERGLPWYVWSLAYFLLFLTVITGWKGQYQDLVYPVCCFIWHLPVGLLTLRKMPMLSNA